MATYDRWDATEPRLDYDRGRPRFTLDPAHREAARALAALGWRQTQQPGVWTIADRSPGALGAAVRAIAPHYERIEYPLDVQAPIAGAPTFAGYTQHELRQTMHDAFLTGLHDRRSLGEAAEAARAGDDRAAVGFAQAELEGARQARGIVTGFTTHDDDSARRLITAAGLAGRWGEMSPLVDEALAGVDYIVGNQTGVTHPDQLPSIVVPSVRQVRNFALGIDPVDPYSAHLATYEQATDRVRDYRMTQLEQLAAAPPQRAPEDPTLSKAAEHVGEAQASLDRARSAIEIARLGTTPSTGAVHARPASQTPARPAIAPPTIEGNER